MNIAILTQPLYTNYGGILQNYALQQFLIRNGHCPITINRRNAARSFPLWKVFLNWGKRFTYRYVLGKKHISLLWDLTLTEEIRKEISKNTWRFIEDHISIIDPVYTDEELLDIYQEKSIDAIIVGSDQCWRMDYSPNIYTYFLNEAPSHVKKIAFSASLGLDYWAIPDEVTTKLRQLIKRFDFVSVREDIAVTLCRDNLGVTPVHLLDPTMLLSKNDYCALIGRTNICSSQKGIYTYILDESEFKSKAIEYVSAIKKTGVFSSNSEVSFSKVGKKGIERCVYPPVEQWIESFMRAELVLTDSFHGTVFSIIFNVPFIVLANQSRGLSRITSLLKTFHLESRLIYSLEQMNESLLEEVIDYDTVNEIIHAEREKSTLYLTKYLN